MEQAIAELHAGHPDDESIRILTLQEHAEQSIGSGSGWHQSCDWRTAGEPSHVDKTPREGGSGAGRAAAIVSMGIALSVVATRASDQAVTWTDLVNVTAGSDVLQKTAGCDGCEDAGAASQSAIRKGDGFVEFTVGETDTFWVGGLSHADADTTIADIDFAFRFNGAGWADVLESGVYQQAATRRTRREMSSASQSSAERFSTAGMGRCFARVRRRRRNIRCCSTCRSGSLGATVQHARIGVADPPPPGGGFIEKGGSPALRARLTRAQNRGVSAANGARGAFTFPAPYNPNGIRLTNASDCGGRNACGTSAIPIGATSTTTTAATRC
jgi:hypothetical protein